ncbi:MAG: hypothetical protein NUV46_04515 [Nanoarchaeota archaeon]|nr:hypothetical protein [Nanoarchaeota archaeon]
MKKLRNFLYAATLTPFIFFGCEENTKNPSNSKPEKSEEIVIPSSSPEIIKPTLYHEIYDSLENKFLEIPGGIEEKVLNKNIRYIDKKGLRKYKIVDSVENNSKFRNLEDLEGGLSQLLTINMMINNFKTIKKVDETNVKDLEEKYIPLKSLMNKIDSIKNKNKKNDYLAFKKIYEKIWEGIYPSYDNTNLPIEEVISGKGGVCRDIVSTYFPLLSYYGYEVGFKIGGIGEALHIWLYSKIGEDGFEIDPSWYGENMIPLEGRIKNDSTYNTLKEEFMKKKRTKK